MVSFKAKPYKVGGSYAVTIPMDYITNNLVNIDNEIELEIKDGTNPNTKNE